MNSGPEDSDLAHVSIVVPVYQGEHTLRALLAEIYPIAEKQKTPAGHAYQVKEVFLVHDGARDRSHVTIQELVKHHHFVKAIWLSRNYGQHPATLAGMASTTSEWVVTMDEDGQNSPSDIGPMLDVAIATGCQLVYGMPQNAPPHGFIRNALSACVKMIFVTVLGNKNLGYFNSFRLIDGEIARSLAAYSGHSVYLDAALSWVVGRSAHCPVTVRGEKNHKSGYSFLGLFNHFYRLLLTSGTRPLRFISLFGIFAMIVACLLSFYALWQKLTAQVPVQGWTSTLIVNCFFFGSLLLSLGIIAEYMAVALNIVMGKPLYLVVSRPSVERDRKP